ncbi:MAG: ABC transporter substrate-binding protein [Gammaproteobacteria bacterium]
MSDIHTKSEPAGILRPIWPVEPVRVGVLIDTEMGTPPVRHFYNAFRMALDEAFDARLLKRPVELVKREVNGLPYGDRWNVIQAWNELVHDEHVVAMAGPIFTENAVVSHHATERDRVPSLGMASGEHWAGPWCFQFPNGAPSEDAALIVNWLVDHGHRTVAVVHEDNRFGDEYNFFFRQQARRRGLKIVSDQLFGTLSPMSLEETLDVARNARADGFVYMGYGADGNRFLRLVHEMDWPGPKLLGSIFMGGSEPGRSFGVALNDLEGWIGIDQFDERNPVTQAVLDRYEKRYGERPRSTFLTLAFDAGNALAEAIAISGTPTPDSVRHGLERVRNLPAAGGGVGTVVTFGPYDHKAYKGPFTSLSTVKNGVILKVD